MVRIVPNSAVKFLTYEQLSRCARTPAAPCSPSLAHLIAALCIQATVSVSCKVSCTGSVRATRASAWQVCEPAFASTATHATFVQDPSNAAPLTLIRAAQRYLPASAGQERRWADSAAPAAGGGRSFFYTLDTKNLTHRAARSHVVTPAGQRRGRADGAAAAAGGWSAAVGSPLWLCHRP